MRWRTTSTGAVEVEAGGRWVRPALDIGWNDTRIAFERTRAWLPLLREHATRTGVHTAHLAGLVYRESGGDAAARNPEDLPGPEDDGVGLLQITHPSLKAKVRPGERLEDPAVNVRIGADYFASLWHGIAGRDLPRAAAAYNAGSVRLGGPPPWGLVASAGHVEAVVRSANRFLVEDKGPRGGGGGGGGGGGALLLAGAAALALLDWR